MNRSLIIALSLLWSTPALAAGGGWSQVAFHAINLAILLWLIIKFAGKPINRAIKAKAEQIEKDISEASRLHAEAKAMLDDYEQKLSRLDADAGELLEQYRKDGEEEKAGFAEEARLAEGPAILEVELVEVGILIDARLAGKEEEARVA